MTTKNSISPMIDKLFSECWQYTKQEKGIQLGRITHTSQEHFLQFFTTWCKEIDRIIQQDLEEKGFVTKGQVDLERLRMFTYEEYGQLFNDNIPVDEYLDYPVYYNCGIDSPAKKAAYRLHYRFEIDDYIKLLQKHLPEKLRRLINGKLHDMPFILPFNGQAQHKLIVGTTGSGKSTLLHHLHYYTDQQYPTVSQIYIDPHGLLASDIQRTKSTNEIVHLSIDKNPGHSFTINILDTIGEDERSKRFAINNLSSTLFEVLDNNKFSSVQKNMMNKLIEFLVDREKSNLQDLLDLLLLKLPIVEEAKVYDEYFRTRFIEKDIFKTRKALLDRFEDVFNSRIIRGSLLGESTLSLPELINKGKTILFDLSGFPEGEPQQAFGKIILAYLKNIMFHRGLSKNSNLVELRIDEAQIFMTESYEIFLSQMRKFGVGVTLAYQYVKQLDNDKIREAIRQNTEIKIMRTRYDADMNKIGNIPSSLEKGEISLKRFEFVADIYGKQPVIFKAPYYLDKPTYHIDAKTYAVNQENTLRKYYKIIETSKEQEGTKDIQERTPLPPYIQDQYNPGFKIKPIEHPSLTKNNLVLYYLGMFKYLTLEQMLDLAIANSPTNIPTGPLNKAGYIKPVKAKLKEEESFKNVFFLVKKGSKAAADFGSPKVHYPTRIIKSIGDWDHVKYVTDHAIAFYKYGVEWMKKDIDRSTVRNQKATHIPHPEKEFEPDIIFQTKNNLYLFEYESINTSFQKCLEKIELHSSFLSGSHVSDFFNYPKQHLTLVVIHSLPILQRIRKTCSSFQYKDRILLKHTCDDPIHGWVDLDGKKRILI